MTEEGVGEGTRGRGVGRVRCGELGGVGMKGRSGGAEEPWGDGMGLGRELGEVKGVGEGRGMVGGWR